MNVVRRPMGQRIDFQIHHFLGELAVNRIFIVAALATMLVMSAAVAWANVLFIPNTYGLSPKSVGLGNAMTAVGDDYSATYFNPGALGAISSNAFDGGYLFAAPRFEGGPKEDGGDSVKFDATNRIALVGFTMDMSTMFKKDHGLGLGFAMAVDDDARAFLSFDDVRDDNGQFARYGLSSVNINAALGVEIFSKLYLGGGAFVMVKGRNTLVSDADLAGNTQQEEIQVEAEPVFAPIVSAYMPIFPRLTFGVTYRGQGMSEFAPIEASADALVSESSLTQLNLNMAFKGTFVPTQVAFGASARLADPLLLALDATWAAWGDYDDELRKGDVVWDDAGVKTRDIIIPRAGAQYDFAESLHGRLGYYYEDTPFVKCGMGNTVVLDNARHVASLGAAWEVTPLSSVLNYAPTLGATYFHQFMQPRTVRSDDGREFESSGSLDGFVASVTLRY